jgi:hypothetical protein
MAEKTQEPVLKELYGGEVVIKFHPASHKYYLVKDGETLPRQLQLSGATGFTGQIDKSPQLMHWACNQYEAKMFDMLGMQVDDKTKMLVEDGRVNGYDVKEVYQAIVQSKGAHREKKEEAGNIGDYVHRFAEYYASMLDEKKALKAVYEEYGDPRADQAERIENATAGLVQFLKKNKVEIIEAEQIIYSRKLRHTGQFDAIAIIGGKKYLIDYKTSNGIYDEHYLQASAYMKAYEEEHGQTFDGALIVAINKEDKPEKDQVAGEVTAYIRKRGQLVKDYKAFKALVDLKNRLKQIPKEVTVKL